MNILSILLTIMTIRLDYSIKIIDHYLDNRSIKNYLINGVANIRKYKNFQAFNYYKLDKKFLSQII